MIGSPKDGFSLVEVAVAVGLLVVGIVILVGLFVPSTIRSSDVGDSATASRLIEGINQELTRLGFGEVRDGIVGSNGLEDKEIWLVATKDGNRILRSGRTSKESVPFDSDAENSLDSAQLPGIAERDRYFLIKLSRLVPAELTDDHLAYSVGKGFLALRVEVTWPYLVPVDSGDYSSTVWDDPGLAGIEAGENRRSSLTSTASVRR